MAGSGYFNFLNSVQPDGVSLGKAKDPLDPVEISKLNANANEMNIHMDYKNALIYPDNLFNQDKKHTFSLLSETAFHNLIHYLKELHYTCPHL